MAFRKKGGNELKQSESFSTTCSCEKRSRQLCNHLKVPLNSFSQKQFYLAVASFFFFLYCVFKRSLPRQPSLSASLSIHPPMYYVLNTKQFSTGCSPEENVSSSRRRMWKMFSFLNSWYVRRFSLESAREKNSQRLAKAERQELDRTNGICYSQT